MSEEAVAQGSTSSTDELATAATDALGRIRELLDVVAATARRIHDLRTDLAKEAEEGVAQLHELTALHEEVSGAAEAISTTMGHSTGAGEALRALAGTTEGASHATTEAQRRADEELSGFAAEVGAVEDDLAAAVDAAEQEATALGERAAEAAETLGGATQAAVEAVQTAFVTETDAFGSELTERVERLSRFLLEEAEVALARAVDEMLGRIDTATGLFDQALADIADETARASEESLERAGAHQERTLEQLETLGADLETLVESRSTIGDTARDDLKDERGELARRADDLRGTLIATLDLIKDVESSLGRYNFVRF